MRKRDFSTQEAMEENSSNNLQISIPEGGEHAPLIAAITSSSVVQSTLTTYLLDLGYRVGGPFANLDLSKYFFANNIPDIIVYDVTSNKYEINRFVDTISSKHPDVPILLISNEDIHINHPYQARLELPINPNSLGQELRYLHKNQKAFNTPIHKLLSFVNNIFVKMLEISPNDLRPLIERSINKFILDFCGHHNDFTRISEESLSIIIKDASFTNISDLINTLYIGIVDLQEDLNNKFESKIGTALINDTLESIIISNKKVPPYIHDLLNKLGINSNQFNQMIEAIIPRLEDHEKSCFVAFLSMGDLGPHMVKHVSNNEQIAQGLDDGVASQILTLVGQGSSYHQGIFGPIPIPTANNIVAMIWSRMLDSNIKDHRMEGRSLSVIAIGFYRELVTYLPPHDTMKSIYSLLDTISHINDVSDDLLYNIQEKFLDCFM